MKRSDDEFLRKVRPLLAAREQDIDAQTLQRLNAARNSALEAAARPRRRSVFVWPAAVALACSAVFALGVWFHDPQPDWPHEVWNDEELETIELIAAEDSLELYEDLDFYEWLAEQGLAEPETAG